MTLANIQPIGRSAIVHDLRSLRLPRGEILLVHSSLRRVGALVEGPKTVLDALHDTCGNNSTIVAPTFTANNSTTTRAYRLRTAGMNSDQLLDEESKIPGFDTRRTPSHNIGILAEYIRKVPGSARSTHPQTSFAAIGPRAEELVVVHELDCHLGEKSPLRWLYDNDAIVMLLGVGFDVCTCFHLAEYRLDKPPRVRLYRAFVMHEGRRELREFYAPDTVDRDFAHIGNAMVEESLVHGGHIGNAPVYWFRLRDGVDFAVRWMNRYR